MNTTFLSVPLWLCHVTFLSLTGYRFALETFYPRGAINLQYVITGSSIADRHTRCTIYSSSPALFRTHYSGAAV